MTSWGPALRIARRELLRAKGRSLLVLLMVLLPVVAVVAGSTLVRTSEIDVVEGLPGSLGTASARLTSTGATVLQDPAERSLAQFDAVPRPSEAQVLALLPEGSQLLAVREQYDSQRLVAADRGLRVTRTAVDLRRATGPYRLLQGTAPASATEVAVTPALVERGVSVGDRVELAGEPRTVTAVVRTPRDSDPSSVLGLPAAVGLETAPVTRWYSSGPAVPWSAVDELNAVGISVLSRAVVLDPPPADQVPAEVMAYDPADEVTYAIVGLVVVMAVLEVVLLAGPALAVGARRQRRSLALMACGGAEPRQVRRVVLAQGVWTGLVAVAVGVPLGLLVAATARAPLTRYAGAEWGPFDVAPLDLLLVSVLAAGTALLAALAPAWAVARQPVVAALHGRRLTSARAARPALLGLVLVGIGLVVTGNAVLGDARYGSYAELGVAAGAIPTVLGAVLLAPAALALTGRLAGRLPLPLRFAVRDADRQRGRTAPAVAAIAATVAGVIALGTGASSDEEQNRLEYRTSGPPGVGTVSTYGLPGVDYDELAAIARRTLPGEQVRTVQGLPAAAFGGAAHTEVQVCRASEQPQDGRCFELAGSYSSTYGSDVLVGTASLPLLAGTVPERELRAAERALRDGAVVVTGPSVVPGEPVELRVTRFTPSATGPDAVEVLATVAAPAARLQTGSDVAPLRALLPERLAAAVGGPVPVGLAVGDDLTPAQERELSAALRRVDEAVSVRVERGYESTGDRTVLLVLSLVAGVLVLGGTLAATSLALTEARPDLTTLGQVGARPRTRRLVAGGYALVLGFVGAVLGVAAGLVPGIAVSVPLTRGFDDVGEPANGWVLDVPWLLLALVLVVLPLASAAVSALAARGRPEAPRRVTA